MRPMRRTLFAAVLYAALAAPVMTQTPASPDLSGTWKLDRSASQITAGVGLAGLDRGGAPNTIYVTQAANGTLTIGSDHNQGLARAYLVGGESQIPAMPSGTVTVRTRWEGGTLVAEGATTGPAAASIKETLTPSKDGETLTITVAATTAAGASSTTLVYARTQSESPCTAWPTPCRNQGDDPRRGR